jgi:hypothetical protein
MSAIRVTHATAEVTATADDYEFADGTRFLRYSAGDLIAAVVTALRAMPGTRPKYGGLSPSEEWLAAIENGASSQGLAMPV